MTKYCLGFAFSPLGDFVVLIRKTKPTWQRGLLNGVGGKVEEGETSLDAMTREFQEETGAVITQSNWKHFTTMKFADDVYVDCFAAQLRSGQEVVTTTEEQVGLYDLYRLPPKSLKNLRWLIPMAIQSFEEEGNGIPHTLDHE